MELPESTGTYRVEIDESYRPLPSVYLALLSIWLVSAFSWTVNTYKNRHFQTNNLQWTLASVPLIKALQLLLSILFWYSCFYHEICSLWLSFGVYITGVFFQTASFVSFLLISHGYCIMYERLSVTERRATAALGCVFYLTLVGYRASVPYFNVLLLLNYLISFYLIFHQISQNLSMLREQLTFIEDEDVQDMHDAVETKYIMFKKFQGAMQIVVMAETVIHINVDTSSENYWLRLLLKEWAQFCILLYIGWTFRSQDLAPRFFVMPTVKSEGEIMLPPIYSMEMDAATFKDFNCRQWHIGVVSKVSFTIFRNLSGAKFSKSTSSISLTCNNALFLRSDITNSSVASISAYKLLVSLEYNHVSVGFCAECSECLRSQYHHRVIKAHRRRFLLSSSILIRSDCRLPPHRLLAHRLQRFKANITTKKFTTDSSSCQSNQYSKDPLE